MLQLILALGLLSASPAPEQIKAGETAPPIQATKWFNHLGQSPDLAALRGKTVLLEFWATW